MPTAAPHACQWDWTSTTDVPAMSTIPISSPREVFYPMSVCVSVDVTFLCTWEMAPILSSISNAARIDLGLDLKAHIPHSAGTFESWQRSFFYPGQLVKLEAVTKENKAEL